MGDTSRAPSYLSNQEGRVSKARRVVLMWVAGLEKLQEIGTDHLDHPCRPRDPSVLAAVCSLI